MKRLLDWRLRHLTWHGLEDVPEVRTLMRLSYLNGLTFGCLGRRVARAQEQALRAVAELAEAGE